MARLLFTLALFAPATSLTLYARRPVSVAQRSRVVCAEEAPTVLRFLGYASAAALAGSLPSRPASRHSSCCGGCPGRDLEFLGPCRFVVVGSGAILEGSGAFENLRHKNGLATVSSDDNSFECHVRLAEVRKAQFDKKEKEEKTLHIVRLLGEDDKSLLSAILTGEDGAPVEADAIKFWEKLRECFGDKVDLLPEAAEA